MVGVVACGAVASIKALWETRIRKISREEEEQRKRRRGGGASGRLCVGVWEDRAVLARLKQKLETEDGRLILRIQQEDWKSLPGCLVQFSQVQEWQIHRTGLQSIPPFISSFQNLLVLDLSRNSITEIPKQIGQLTRLRELVLSYNRVQFVPEELSGCESLERLDLAMNRSLDSLPDQLSNLKKLQHLDLSMNEFCCVPDCVVALPALQWLDMGGNRLQYLPEDIHRFVNFRDNPLTLDVMLPCRKTKNPDEEEEEEEDEEEEDREMFGREFMQMYIQEARKRAYAVLNVHRANS